MRQYFQGRKRGINIILTTIILLGSITQADYNGRELLSDLVAPKNNQFSTTSVLYKGIRKNTTDYLLIQQAIDQDILKNKTSFLGLKSEFDRDSVRIFVLKNFGIDLEIYGPESLDTETRQWIIDTIQVQIERKQKEHQDQINNTIVNTIHDHSIKDFSGSSNQSDILIKEIGDPYTNYLTGTEQRLLDQMLHGKLVGIGIVIHKPADDHIRISKVLSGSPAMEAGLQMDDLIIAIDDHKITASDSIYSLTNRIQGAVNTSVSLQIQRGKSILNTKITRKEIKIDPIQTEEISTDTLLVTISTFQVGIYDDFKKLLPTLQQYKHLIIDLRNNGGGSLDDTRKMLNHIVPRKQTIYYMTNKEKKTAIISKGVTKTRSLKDKHITFLINKYTASASEIFAGVSREYSTYTRILGEQSHGKGSVQTVRNYDDGSTLKVTTAYRSLGKSDTSIQDKGLTPDVTLTNDPFTPEDEVIQYALKTS